MKENKNPYEGEVTHIEPHSFDSWEEARLESLFGQVSDVTARLESLFGQVSVVTARLESLFGQVSVHQCRDRN